MENIEVKELIAVQKIPKIVDEIKKLVNKPADIDSALIELGISPFLLNLYLATPRNLSFLNIGIEKALYVPRQVTTDKGGRKSLYFLEQGEAVIAGAYFTVEGILIRRVTRLSGASEIAKTGDKYKLEILSLDETIILSAEGLLEIEDDTKGIGSLSKLTQTSDSQIVSRNTNIEPLKSIWVAWSFIDIEK
ncbi:hypothetical protein [Chryseobacterium caseinilyticum]|uniref:Uncharacterized protein n=1 Tax=Chryseobacterium caseinilyticum TaxID=2771428 RepID=A0ABR8Z9L9_9FLAO|nr:hypothetical protein [Chryseobacterium caseinilyticum]MBD8081979.1 hypothetical protein [Chryseobacterium caseinilyticum]